MNSTTTAASASNSAVSTSAKPSCHAKVPLEKYFKSDGDLRLLKRTTPVPVFDGPISFYEYLVIDIRTKRKIEHEIDHDTGECSMPLPRMAKKAEHKYFYNGVPQTGSATGYVHSFFKPFDSMAVSTMVASGKAIFINPKKDYYRIYRERGAEEMAVRWLSMYERFAEGDSTAFNKRHPLLRPETTSTTDEEYMQMYWDLLSLIHVEAVPEIYRRRHHRSWKSPQFAAFRLFFVENLAEILRTAWKENSDEACRLGRIMHRCIELCYNGGLNLSDPNFHTPEMQQFARFHKFWVLPRRLTMLRTELSLAHCPDPSDPTSLLCGTIDAVFIDPDGRIVLVDWKRSKQIETEAYSETDVGTGPCRDLPNCNYYHYQMQLNTYSCMLQANTAFIVKSCHIAVFHPNQSDYAVYDVHDYQDRVREAIALYAKQKRHLTEDMEVEH